MKFRVGPWTYRIKIAQTPLVDSDGDPAAALWLWDERTLLLSPAINPGTRVDALAHELRHAWQSHFGRPADDEGDANNASSFSVDFMRQLATQGGEAALMRLTAEGIIDMDCGPVDLACEIAGAQCLGCGGSFSAAQVITEPAKFNGASGSLHVSRAVYCDFCGHVQRWIEGATQAGLPNGQILGSPRILRGQAVQEFLRLHSFEFGMVSR